MWKVNSESDFSHYRVEFGFFADHLDRSFVVAEPTVTFTLLPFLPAVYFRFQAFDKSDHSSAVSPLYSTAVE